MAASADELQTQLTESKAQVELCTLEAVCGRSFVNTARLAAGWLNAARIEGILRTIWFKEVNPQDTGQEIWDKSFRIFCIVASLDRPELIRTFNELDYKDDSLPEFHQVSLENRLRDAGCTDAHTIAQSFVQVQWPFCAWTFKHGDSNKRHLENRILPIPRQELIGRGGTAELYQIEVPEELLDQSLKDAFPRSVYPRVEIGTCYRFALKVFRESGFADYENEKNAFHALRQHNGFVRCLGTFVWKSKHLHASRERSHTMPTPQTYNILLEYGDSDLEVYFATRHPPFFAGEIHNFWDRLFDLASALEKLHNLKPENGATYRGWLGWHADIKPANILLIEDNFRLADPGFAQFVQDGFAQEAKAYMRGGTVAYGAPELPRGSHEQKAVSQKIDIWSLGCVFSVAATWVVGGHPAVAQFKQIRKDAIKQLGSSGDWFHDGHNVLDAILEWHRILRENLRNSDPITKQVLELIENKMLVADSQARCDAKALCLDLRHVASSSRPPKLPLTSITKGIMQSLQSVDNQSPDQPSKSYSGESQGEQQSDHQKKRQRLLVVDDKKTAFRSEYLSQKIGSGEPVSPLENTPAAAGSRISPGSQRTLPSRGHHPYPSIDTTLSNQRSNGTSRQAKEDSPAQRPVSSARPPMSHRRTPKERPHEQLSVFQARDKLKKKYNNKLASAFRNVMGKKSHKDEILRGYYDNRDIKFLIDNSGSMRGHWSQVKYVATTLVWHCSGQDDDGIDVDFTRPNDKSRKIDHEELAKLMEDKNIQPIPGVETDMEKCLQKLFQQLLKEYKRKRKNISLIILTDGKWDGMDLENGSHTIESIKTAIAFFVDEIMELVGKNMPCPVGIQFVQFGNDAFATENLRSLDNDLCIERGIPDVIDLEPADEDVNKMLLGNFVTAYDFADADDDSVYARSGTQSPESLVSPSLPPFGKAGAG